jgi:hypothetical protein
MPQTTEIAAPTIAPVQGLGLRAGMSFEAWVLAGRRISQISNAASWGLGDWLLFGERAYGRRYKAALEVTGFDYQTLRNYAWVARRYPPARRRLGVSFQHHAELAALPEPQQELWLERAERLGWSRNELRRRLADQRRPPRDATRAAALTLSMHVAAEREERWRRAAEIAEQALAEWMTAVIDAAAEAALERMAAA